MDCQEIKKDLEGLISGQIYLAEPMQKHTTWKVGGPADIMVLPLNSNDVCEVVRYAVKKGIPLHTVGNGSNLLVLDKGIRGIVLKLNKCLDEIKVQDNLVIAGGGAILPKVARLAISKGLKGLEFAVGIPASVGGAITMKAGAHGNSISEVVREVKVVNPKGDLETIPVDDLGYQYRSSRIKNKGFTVVEAVFHFAQGDVEEMKKNSREESGIEKDQTTTKLSQCG